ncbi:hypothetical protein M413DRAFT_446913 [Hebeloma cylindrosporum]|uniref:Uncharacterized protein n=1 Tax=Hebeloma cylindrosporum TaxID=76867 RepID=A0A0C2XQY6_HEBCY|nr:hypothetical protein M413DRAFT_446913 [Hebeloma cylindrosporum h7]
MAMASYCEHSQDISLLALIFLRFLEIFAPFSTQWASGFLTGAEKLFARAHSTPSALCG